MKMEIKTFEEKNIIELEHLIYRTIDNCYSGVYCDEAIAYFKNFHSKENIAKDAQEGITFVLFDDSWIIGTGTLLKTEIRRVFVLREFQGQGAGKRIMHHLEETALQKGIKQIVLCSSLVSKIFYDRLGYKTVKDDYIQLEGGKRLEYYDMFKVIDSI